jgi:hypothetical protein
VGGWAPPELAARACCRMGKERGRSHALALAVEAGRRPRSLEEEPQSIVGRNGWMGAMVSPWNGVWRGWIWMPTQMSGPEYRPCWSTFFLPVPLIFRYGGLSRGSAGVDFIQIKNCGACASHMHHTFNKQLEVTKFVTYVSE